MLQYVEKFHSSLLLNNILHYFITHSSAMDINVFFLLWGFYEEWGCEHLCTSFWCTFFSPFLFSIYLGMKLMDHIVTQCLASLGTAKMFSIWLHKLTFPPVNKGSAYSPILILLSF